MSFWVTLHHPVPFLHRPVLSFIVLSSVFVVCTIVFPVSCVIPCCLLPCVASSRVIVHHSVLTLHIRAIHCVVLGCLVLSCVVLRHLASSRDVLQHPKTVFCGARVVPSCIVLSRAVFASSRSFVHHLASFLIVLCRTILPPTSPCESLDLCCLCVVPGRIMSSRVLSTVPSWLVSSCAMLRSCRVI